MNNGPPPTPLASLIEVWEVWRVCCLVTKSTQLDDRGLGGFNSQRQSMDNGVLWRSHRTLNTEHRTSNLVHRTLNIEHRKIKIEHRTLNI